VGEPTDYLAQLVKAIPVKVRSTLLVLSLAALGYLVWHNTASAVGQITGKITELDTRVTVIETDHAHIRDAAQDMQRWMCFQNRPNAELAGIACASLIGGLDAAATQLQKSRQ
jgi:hypothetical protein